MNFDLSDEQRMLFDQSLQFLSDRCTSQLLRSVIDHGREWDAALWKEAAELGFLGVAIPETYGGMGLGWLDVGLISEALGRVNAPLPVFSSAVLAAQAILLAGSEAQKARWLPRIVSGETIAAFAYAENGRSVALDALNTRFEDGRLHGVKAPVADAGIATLAVVPSSSAQGPTLAVVALDQDGVARKKLDSFDELRAHYRLSFDSAAAEPLANPDGNGIERLFDRVLDRAAVQAAFEAIGGSDACLQMARGYAMDRRIFGRSLASYQAIKHKLADILVGIELARSSAYFAAWSADHAPDTLPRAAAEARLMAIDAFERAARENMQVHGGISYTYEADCHFYYRRERTLASSLGGRDLWASRLVAALRTSPTLEG